MVGQGSVNHNSRAFNAKNTDPERSHLNITYCHENIKAVFHELFDEALKRYNDKQTRADRKMEDYYEKIRSSKQEKPSMRLCQVKCVSNFMGEEFFAGNILPP